MNREGKTISHAIGNVLIDGTIVFGELARQAGNAADRASEMIRQLPLPRSAPGLG